MKRFLFLLLAIAGCTPTLDDFSVSPDTLPAATGGLVSCFFAVTEPEVARDRSCTFRSPSRDVELSCIAYGGAPSCSFLVPEAAEIGTWVGTNVAARNTIGERILLRVSELVGVVGETSFEVTNTAGVSASGGGVVTGATGRESNEEWPSGPATTCTPDVSIASRCICEGVEYSSGFCCTGGFSWSSCSSQERYVTVAGRGSQDGSDWANAFAGLPATLTRDRVYWIASGDYGSAPYHFDDAPSGSSGITIRKATASAHGTEIGWETSLGTGGARFGRLIFDTERYTLDGGELPIGDSGIRASVSTLVDDTGDPEFANGDLIYVNAPNVVLRRIYADGSATQRGLTQITGTCSGIGVSSLGDNLVLDQSRVINAADDGLEIAAADSVTVARSRIHAVKGCGTDGSDCKGPCFNGHGDGIEAFSTSNLRILNNLIYDINDTSAILVDDASRGGSPNTNLLVEGNIGYVDEGSGQLPITIKYVDGARLLGNVFWGVLAGNRFGGCFFDGDSVDNLVMRNNICTNINFNFNNTPGAGNGEYDSNKHDIDYNQFGVLVTTEFPDGESLRNNQVGDPRFMSIRLSSDLGEHSSADMLMDQFRLQPKSPAIDSGTTAGSGWAIDGTSRPGGHAYDMGVFEFVGAASLATECGQRSNLSAAETCARLGRECGTHDDGCGGTVDCGACGASESRVGVKCEAGSDQPTPSNTGVTDEDVLRTWTKRGYPSTPVTTDGITYENFTLNGGLTVSGGNNTFRNCRITGGTYAFRTMVGANGNVVEDCEIIGGNSAGFFVQGNNTLLRRVHVRDTHSDSGKIDGNNTVIECSLIEKPGADGDCSGHIDMPQIGNQGPAENTILRFNTIQGQICPCSAGPYLSSNTILLESSGGGSSDLLVQGNWINGASGLLMNGSTSRTTILIDNRFGTYFRRPGNLCGSGLHSFKGGNVWDCDGKPVTSCSPTLPSCAVPFPGVCPGSSIY